MMTERNLRKPELLAPAGSKAAWAAAVLSGADAVYLGLNDYSARAYADNFSLAELKGVTRESRAAGVKIYIAFNTLIKEGELEKAWSLLHAALDCRPQALIIQDLGLARLVRRHYPEVEIHASTLMAVHSVPGLVVLSELGFDRAVLARELALDEIAAISRNSPIGVEVFIHGALCFSFSGLCLMSSFLGGRSALRGGCTQPCRRAYQYGGRKGAIFSTTDLSAAPYMDQLREMPIAAFKIEGRMKGPDYVGRVVAAYRLLLDAAPGDWPQALERAQSLLAEVPGRRTTGGLLAARTEGALAPLSPTTSGLRLGLLTPAGPGQGLIRLERALARGDRLRLQSGTGEESPAFNVKGLTVDGRPVSQAEPGREALIEAPKLPEGRGLLFKVASGGEEKKYLASPLVQAVKKNIDDGFSGARPVPAIEGRKSPKKKAVSSSADPRRLGLWFWLERVEDLADIFLLNPKKVILPLTIANVRELKNQRRRFRGDLDKIVWSFPPLIFRQAQTALGRELGGLLSLGFQEFLVSNLAQVNMIKRAGPRAGDLKIWGDHRLGVLNRLTEEALVRDLGLRGTALSLEIDLDTAKKLWKAPAPGGRLIYLYGRPALFTSRFPLETRKIPITSPKGEKFRLDREGGEIIVRAEKPVFLAQLLKMPPLEQGAGLIIDLRGEPRPAREGKKIKEAIAEGRGGAGSAFNLKRGLV